MAPTAIPRQFLNPDVLDATRSNSRSHLTFGAGPHFCLGNQLARGELRIAFATLLQRLLNIRLADTHEPVAWMSHFLVYGPHKLLIAFEAA
ncbi:cytochrome P450 [Novosphingobium sp. G106]|nr:cytochrome P450 [Novosphingobium sp. G106]MBV1688539.1 cytochrome P450 [Novosphingobium sp. G106]